MSQFTFLYRRAHHRFLHSFPTRRSSDLSLFRGGEDLLCAMGFGFLDLFDRARVTLAHQQDGHRRVNKLHLERSEEHTSELQSPYDLVCRLLLEKKNI